MITKEKILSLLLCIGMLAAFVGIGCGIYYYTENNRVSEGYITDKIYSPADYSINSDGKHNYYPARYYFTIAGENGGEYSEWTIDVTEGEYNSYKVGDYYPWPTQ